jgi:hypothetical protein
MGAPENKFRKNFYFIISKTVLELIKLKRIKLTVKTKEFGIKLKIPKSMLKKVGNSLLF